MERIDVKNQINDAIKDGKRTIILCAPGGYGKSYLAREYCDESVLQYPAFFSARGLIRDKLTGVFQREFPNEAPHADMQDGAFAAFLYSQLDSKYDDPDEWVVTFDDVALKKTEFKEFVREFMYVPGKGKLPKGIVFFTTQNCWDFKNKHVAIINVDKVEEETAKGYLQDTIQGVTEEDIQKILEATGRIALPLSIAGASIVQTATLGRKSISNAVIDFCNEVTTLDATAPSDIDYDKNLYNAIHVTVDNIKNYEEEPNTVYDFLMCSAITAPTQFERQAEYSSKLGIVNWKKAHSAIVGWHLFEADNSFSMHPTTQDVLLHIDKDNNQEVYYERLCRAASAFLSLYDSDEKAKDGCIRIRVNDGGNQYSSEFETAKRIQMLLRDAIDQAKTSKYYSILCKHLYSLSYAVAYYYYSFTNNYRDRERYYQNAYDAVVKLIDIESGRPNEQLLYRKAAQLKYWAVALRALDRNDEAEKRLNEAIEIYDNIDKNACENCWHELATESYYNRGLVRSDKGHNEDVFNDYIRSSEIAEKYRLEKQKAVAQRCMGIYYRDTGNYPEAIKKFKESIESDHDVNEARCLTCIGLVYVMTGDFPNAIDNCEKAVDAYKTAKVPISYNPLLHIEMCFRKQGIEDLSKQYLIDASKLLFGDSTDSIANQMAAILDGSKKNVTLNAKDYRRNGIACMLLCVRCIEHIIAFSSNIRDNKNIQKLLDFAFSVRNDSFRRLRDNLTSVKDESFSIDEVENAVKSYTDCIVYNKLTCATLMLACAEYYNKCEENKQAFVFALAAYYLSDAHNYAYGRESSVRLIASFSEPYNRLPLMSNDKQNEVLTATESQEEHINPNNDSETIQIVKTEQKENGVAVKMSESMRKVKAEDENEFVHDEELKNRLYTKVEQGINLDLFGFAANSSLYRLAIGEYDIDNEQLMNALGQKEARRNDGSIKLMKAIWRNHPELGLPPDYDYLAKLEYSRSFHSKYRDHTTHMFKVFLLGLYLYEKLDEISNAVNKSGLDDNGFLSVWTMTALYHDVGYLVENDRENNEIYKRLSEVLSQPLTMLYPNEFGTGTEKGIIERKGIVTQRIERMYPIKSALRRFEGKGESVRLTVHKGNPILTYFEFVTRKPDLVVEEDQTRIYFDHGIASAGMMLFLQDSLCKYCEQFPESELYDYQKQRVVEMRRAAQTFKSYAEIAAYAIALHNIMKDWSGNRLIDITIEGVTLGDFIIPLKAEPIAYLLRLCDELQCWDRQYFISAGEGGIPLDGNKLCFQTENERLGMLFHDQETKKDIIDALEGILEPSVSDILQLM